MVEAGKLQLFLREQQSGGLQHENAGVLRFAKPPDQQIYSAFRHGGQIEIDHGRTRKKSIQKQGFVTNKNAVRRIFPQQTETLQRTTEFDAAEGVEPEKSDPLIAGRDQLLHAAGEIRLFFCLPPPPAVSEKGEGVVARKANLFSSDIHRALDPLFSLRGLSPF